MRIDIIHLDLGLGGAEKLVVNIAVNLKDMGHDVEIFTSHHDPNRCFKETIGDGKLANHIHVYGDFLPRQIFRRWTVICGIIKMLYLAIHVIFSEEKPDVVFIDGVSIPIPFLKLFGIPVLFYCHFPDKLLCVERSSFAKKAYRFVIDHLEEITTGMADVIVVNSNYTAGVFKSSFEILGELYSPAVLYPTIEMPQQQTCKWLKSKSFDTVEPPQYLYKNLMSKSLYKYIFVSLNRYERKKNIKLLLQSTRSLFEELQTESTKSIYQKGNDITDDILVVIAGGYDERVDENVSYYQELNDYAKMHGISTHVVFRKSISDEERNALLYHAGVVVYTPANEHFGIVPIEALDRKSVV